MSDVPSLRSLPRVDVLARTPPLATRLAGDALKVEAARHVIAVARAAALDGAAIPSAETLAEHAAAWLDAELTPTLRPVLNATGIVVHTNLGRAPLAPEAVAAALGACTLEYDVATGRRGHRRAHAERLLVALTGAEAAIVVNNNAAAVVLMLRALAGGRKVLISRGELVEIGGSFRVPEIMAAAGVQLVEVGTTNRTHLRDYRAAYDADTAAILRVHPSNYRVEGFTTRPTIADLGALARELGTLFLHDLGSAWIGPTPAGLAPDTRLADTLAAGVDVACFSGDKVLGGPQAGLLLGRRAAIDALARDPLMRAMRPDKLTLAALQHTLSAIRSGDIDRIPGQSMLHCSAAALERRARALAVILADLDATIAAVRTEDAVGAGSHPGETLAGWGLRVAAPAVGATALAHALRLGEPAVVGVVREGAVTLHLRAIAPADDDRLADAVRGAVSRSAPS